MKSLSLITILSICLLLVAGSALAEREVNVTRVAQDVQELNAAKSAAADCSLGNLNPAYYAITDWVWGAESYGYVFDADATGCTCSEGFVVEAAHMYLQFGIEDVPVTFDVTADFNEAAWEPTLGCWQPGPVITATPVYTVTIEAAGLYDISLPIPPMECAFFGYWYGITFNYITSFDSNPELVTDNVPVGCTSWNDYGAGWLDLLDFGMPGEVNIFVDINCCANPVSADSNTMGDVKALFR